MKIHNLHKRGDSDPEWVFCVKFINNENDEWSPYLNIKQNNQPDLNQIKVKADDFLKGLNKEQTELKLNEETGEETLEVIKPAGSWRIA